MKRLLLYLLLLPMMAMACLNDRDTAAIEARNNLELVNVLAGRFERNPPLYFEMRIARIEKELARDPAQPALYDDIAVAEERLGKHDEAIRWIRQKEPYLTGAPSEQVYSYHANLGTFYAHKWFADPSEDKTLLKQSLNELEQALAIKPDAHFGREAAQVYLIRKKIDPYLLDTERPFWNNQLKYQKALLGLMTLGSAWESKEVWEEVRETTDEHKGGLTAMVERRLEELGEPAFRRFQPDSDRYYDALVKNGKEWQAHRTEFMMARLQAGQHPDTDPHFWDGYVEVPPVDPKPYEPNWWNANRSSNEAWLALGIAVLVLVVGTVLLVKGIGWLCRRLKNKKGPPPL